MKPKHRFYSYLTAATLNLSASLLLISPVKADACETGNFYYLIQRKNETTGRLNVNVSKDNNNQCVVQVSEWVFDFPHYCHQLKRKEIWKEGRLYRYRSKAKGWCSTLANLSNNAYCSFLTGNSPTVFTSQIDEEIRIHSLSRKNRIVRSIDPVSTMSFLNLQFSETQNRVKMIDPINGNIISGKIVLVEEDDSKGTYSFETKNKGNFYFDENGMLHSRTYNRKLAGNLQIDLIKEQVELPQDEDIREECKEILNNPLHID